MSNTKKILRSSFSIGALQIVEVIAGIILMPFLINTLGTTQYGIWIIIFSFISYISLLTLGLSSATQRAIAEALGKNDKEGVNRVITNSLIIFTFIGGVILVVTIFLAFLGQLFFDNTANQSTYQWVILIVGLKIALTVPVSVYMGILQANMRLDIQSNIELIGVFCRFTLIIIIVPQSAHLITLAWIIFFVDLFTKFGIILITKIKYPEIVAKRNLYEKEVIAELFGFGFFSTITWIAERIRGSAHNLIIAKLLGAAIVPLFSVPFMLTVYASQFFTPIINTFTPLMIIKKSEQDVEGMHKTLSVVRDLSLFSTFLVAIGIAIFGFGLFQLLLGPEFLESYKYLVIISVSLVLITSQQPLTNLFTVFNIQRNLSYLIVTEVVVIVSLELLLAPKFHLIGVAVGLVLPLVITRLFIQPLMLRQYISFAKINYKSYYLKFSLLSLLFVGISSALIHNPIVITNWFFLVGSAIFYCMMFSLLYYFTFLSKEAQSYALLLINKKFT